MEVDDNEAIAIQGSALEQLKVIWMAIRTTMAKLQAVEVQPLQAIADAFLAATSSTRSFFVAWYTFWAMLFTPLLQALRILLGDAWPMVSHGFNAAWDWQASQPPAFLAAEGGVLLFLSLCYFLQRFIARRRYVHKVRTRIYATRRRVSTSYQSFMSGVEKKSRLAAKLLPHACFGGAAAAAEAFMPAVVSALADGFAWNVLAILYPVVSSLFLLSGLSTTKARWNPPSRASAATAATPATPRQRSRETASDGAESAFTTPGAPGRDDARVPNSSELSKALMYWVIFAFLCCCHYLVSVVPFAARAAARFPALAHASFFLFLWLQLPGPAAGLHVVYAAVEPLIRRHVRRPAVSRRPGDDDDGLDDGAPATFARAVLGVCVMMRFISERRAAVIVENIADSWMVLPSPLFFFTPGFMAYAGCLYVGAVVPALNTVKAIARLDPSMRLEKGATTGARSAARSSAAASARNRRGSGGGGSSSGAAATTEDPTAQTAARWLSYWVVYGVYWYVHLALAPFLRYLPLSTHLQLALLVWLQLPYFRGATRLIDRLNVGVDLALGPLAKTPGKTPGRLSGTAQSGSSNYTGDAAALGGRVEPSAPPLAMGEEAETSLGEGKASAVASSAGK